MTSLVTPPVPDQTRGMEISAVESLALALGLGLLVGLQREWSAIT